jgi:bacterioferritin
MPKLFSVEADMATEGFVLDVEDLRERARRHMENGPVTDDFGLDVGAAVQVLNAALATEVVCVLRYKQHAVVVQGIDSEPVKREFEEHARDEMGHADRLAERINQLGGKPNYNPDGMLGRAHSEYVEGANLIDMISEDLVAERIAIESYRSMVSFFGDKDTTTRRMLEEILAKEEEHADDLHALLVARQGRPMLPH